MKVFSDGNKKRLQELGLNDASINELEETLHYGESVTSSSSDMKSVRAKLNGIKKALKQLQKELTYVVKPTSDTNMEVFNRLILAAYDLKNPSYGTQQCYLLDSIFNMLSSTEKALRDLPSAQRRPNVINTWPVSRIWQILVTELCSNFMPSGLKESEIRESNFYKISNIYYEELKDDVDFDCFSIVSKFIESKNASLNATETALSQTLTVLEKKSKKSRKRG